MINWWSWARVRLEKGWGGGGGCLKHRFRTKRGSLSRHIPVLDIYVSTPPPPPPSSPGVWTSLINSIASKRRPASHEQNCEIYTQLNIICAIAQPPTPRRRKICLLVSTVWMSTGYYTTASTYATTSLFTPQLTNILACFHILYIGWLIRWEDSWAGKKDGFYSVYWIPPCQFSFLAVFISPIWKDLPWNFGTMDLTQGPLGHPPPPPQ